MSGFRQGIETAIPALRRYARALTRDVEMADDLVQDTLVRALRSEHLFHGGDVRTWLYTILTNLNRNRLRSLARRPILAPLGAAAGWFGHAVWEAPRPLAAVATEAVEAHRLYIAERRHPIEVQAGESHLIPWLSRRVGTSLPAPDLAAQGLRLLGGRLLPGLSGHAAALFMYEAASGERFTLYCRRAKAPGSAPSYRDSGQVGSFSWAREETACVLSGPADRARLEGVAGSAYRQLEQRATRTGALTAD